MGGVRAGRLWRRPAFDSTLEVRVSGGTGPGDCPSAPQRVSCPSPIGGWLLVTGGPATGKTVFGAQWFQAPGPIARNGGHSTPAIVDRPERF
jgi:hypothetical protein